MAGQFGRWRCFALIVLAAVSAPSQAGRGTTDARSATPAQVTGRLANGLRYAILSRKNGEPGLGLVLRNEGGFIAERRPGERGLAHLIEHIVFHSPMVAAPDDLDHFRRVGLPLTLPAPAAGSTSWRETNYYLSTRSTAPGDLATLLGLFRDAASGMTLRADAVDRSRAEVVAEMAAKKAGNRTYASYVAAVAPGSPNDVIDAQNSDDVPTASIATLRSLYRRLYRPDTTTIVVVGDVDIARTRELIAAAFGDWKVDGPVPARRAYPAFRADRIRPVSFDAAADGRNVALMSVVTPTPLPPSSRDAQADAMLMDRFVTQLVQDRLAASVPAGRTGMSIENGDQGYRQIMMWDEFGTGDWRPAVAGLRRTACDLLTGDITPAEWTRSQQRVIDDLRHAAATLATTPNVDMARDWSHAIADGRYLILPDELLRRTQVSASRVDAGSATRWWRRQWRAGREHLRVETAALAPIADPMAAITAAADAAEGANSCKTPHDPSRS